MAFYHTSLRRQRKAGSDGSGCGDGPATWTADARVLLQELVYYQQLVHPTWLYGLLGG